MTNNKPDKSEPAQSRSQHSHSSLEDAITADYDLDLQIDHSEFDVDCEWSQRYLAYRTTPNLRQKTLTDGSAQQYETRLREWVNFVDDLGETVLTANYEDFITFIKYCIRIGRRTSTIMNRVWTTKMLYKHIAVREDEVEANISPLEIDEIEKEAIDEHTPNELERADISKEEVLKLFENINSTRNRLMAVTAVETGFRNSDIRGIRLIDIDLDEPEITAHDPKYGEPYTVPISEELALELQIWLQRGRDAILAEKDSRYLFPSEQGGKLETHGSLGQVITEAAEEAGIQGVLGYTEYKTKYMKTDEIKRTWYEVVPHTLRHTFITLLEKEGVSLEYRRLLANHQSVETTQRYSHGKQELLKSAQDRINLH